MWLINTRTYELESITNPDPASYAILSHTWQDDEVSFQDYQKLGKLGRLRGLREALSKIRSKKVLQKVFKTVQMARSRGLRYAWVDTCCIDKSSSAELSEAINSMFRWYENAAVCFTYLADLPSLKQLRKKYSEAEFDELLQGQNGFFFSCRWFKRGWTLQELIAPRNVEFYDCEWNEYGKRTLLWEPIRAITKIPVEVLDKSASLQSIPVAQRMSWAAHRSTTRVEDMAYCLLGIFDLNMTLLYGEGSKAFIRLQEEICRQSTDLSLFAWRAHDSWPLYRGIFASSPWEFNECHSLGFRYNWKYYNGEFRVTNRGLCLDECRLYGQDGSLILPLDCFHQTKNFTHELIGIVLAKTPHGYVRVEPNAFERIQCPKGGGWANTSWEIAPRIYIVKSLTPVASANLENQSVLLDLQNLKLHKIFTSAGKQYDPARMTLFSTTDNLSFAMLVDKVESRAEGEENNRERYLIGCFDIWYGKGRGSVLCHLRHFDKSKITDDQIAEEVSAVFKRRGNHIIPPHLDYTPCSTCRANMVDLHRHKDLMVCDVRMTWKPRTDRSGAVFRISHHSSPEKGCDDWDGEDAVLSLDSVASGRGEVV